MSSFGRRGLSLFHGVLQILEAQQVHVRVGVPHPGRQQSAMRAA